MRESYPRVRDWDRDEDTDYADRPPPPEPTDCPPGSVGKVDAMAARVAAGVGLWHPNDAMGE